ncbi:hypothetical protein GGX14DRAFT_594041 [Mycena pura]|uniref:Uncharacterized protein n=1 Tax=Mycena pura TaxID=153505 RepID=A0AAD6Y1W1_9AGAR|nr:hypothetical protein GGX14DRAFT_594041 [Mycena pura]
MPPFHPATTPTTLIPGAHLSHKHLAAAVGAGCHTGPLNPDTCNGTCAYLCAKRARAAGCVRGERGGLHVCEASACGRWWRACEVAGGGSRACEASACGGWRRACEAAGWGGLRARRARAGERARRVAACACEAVQERTARLVHTLLPSPDRTRRSMFPFPRAGSPPKIKSIRIVENPFDDIVPRITAAEKRARDGAARARGGRAAQGREERRNVQLLSFGGDEDEGTAEPVTIAKKAIACPDLVNDSQAASAMPDFAAILASASASKPAVASATASAANRPAASKKSNDITKIREKHAQEASSSATLRKTEIAKMEAEIRMLARRRDGDSDDELRKPKKSKSTSYLEEGLAQYAKGSAAGCVRGQQFACIGLCEASAGEASVGEASARGGLRARRARAAGCVRGEHVQRVARVRGERVRRVACIKGERVRRVACEASACGGLHAQTITKDLVPYRKFVQLFQIV